MCAYACVCVCASMCVYECECLGVHLRHVRVYVCAIVCAFKEKCVCMCVSAKVCKRTRETIFLFCSRLFAPRLAPLEFFKAKLGTNLTKEKISTKIPLIINRINIIYFLPDRLCILFITCSLNASKLTT